MRSNRLQLNASKTEVLWCASAHRQSQLPSDSLAVGSDLLSPVSCVRDLGIYVDADLSMRTQVIRTCSKCVAALRQLRSIRRSVSNDVLQSFVVALVFSRLDYESATFAGLPKQLLDRLQSVQNAVRRLIFTACRQDHVQPLLRSLHWLRVPERISFRQRCWCIAASMALHPATWRQISSASLTLTLFGDRALQVRQHLSVHVLCVLPSATMPSRQLPHLFRTVCQSQFGIVIIANFSW